MQEQTRYDDTLIAGQRKLRVLVVEDEALLSLSLEAMLEEWGHEQVGSVPTGRAGIRLAGELHPDVVLMDINLAGDMDGLSAASTIREICDARIIFMTAYSDRDLSARPEVVSAEVLHKPFSPRRLQELLTSAALAVAVGGAPPAGGTGCGDNIDSR